MKALIFSDSHGRVMYMKQALMMHRDIDVCFFLGDGLDDFFSLKDQFPEVMMLPVMGNCDWFFSKERADKEGLFTMEGRKIFYTHGHLYGVKGGYGQLISEALKRKADVVLFGHTHVPYSSCDTEGENPLYVFNPGSIGYTYEGSYHYGLLDIRENGILLSHGRF